MGHKCQSSQVTLQENIKVNSVLQLPACVTCIRINTHEREITQLQMCVGGGSEEFLCEIQAERS